MLSFVLDVVVNFGQILIYCMFFKGQNKFSEQKRI
jgi:hypothetical protein